MHWTLLRSATPHAVRKVIQRINKINKINKER